MSVSTAPAEIEPRPDTISGETRARLHRRLDELIDKRNVIASSVAANGMNDATADLLQHHAEQLVLRSISLASELSGGDARAIAFRHEDPCSRAALARFLNAVAEFAAPYAYATLDLGLETFTWTDVMGALDNLRALDHGDIEGCMRPSPKRRKRGAAYAVLREKWRALQWVAYLSGFVEARNLHNVLMGDSAVLEVAEAYGVHRNTIYNWVRETAQIEGGHLRSWALEEARREGEARLRPNFTRSPYGDEVLTTYGQWLKFDAEHYTSTAKSAPSKR